MIAFIISPLGRAIGGALAIIAIIGGIYWKGRNDGANAIEQKQQAQRADDLEKRLEIERAAQPCLADTNCVLPDPFRLRPVRPDPGK